MQDYIGILLRITCYTYYTLHVMHVTRITRYTYCTLHVLHVTRITQTELIIVLNIISVICVWLCLVSPEKERNTLKRCRYNH